jgi:hypothetical protein
MSLINDALKRAKEAQQQKPPGDSGGPPLRPVEQRPARDPGPWLLLAFALIVAVAAILLWQGFQHGRPPQTVASQSPPPAETVPQMVPATGYTSIPDSVAPVSSPPALPAVPELHATPIAAAGGAALITTPDSPSPTNGSPDTTVAEDATAVESPPQPPPLRLQAIVYHPSRASAAISGKVLFVGDRLGEMRVTAISPTAVTLVGEGRTNVLTLPQ